MTCYKCNQRIYSPWDDTSHVDSYFQDEQGLRHLNCNISVAKELEKANSKIKKLDALEHAMNIIEKAHKKKTDSISKEFKDRFEKK